MPQALSGQGRRSGNDSPLPAREAESQARKATPALTFGNIIYMNWREHPPAHFHAVYGEHEAVISIDGAVHASDLPHRALSMVPERLAVHRADELSGEVFEALRDPALFATAYQHLAMRTVAWANGVDLAPEFLLELMNTQQRQAA